MWTTANSAVFPAHLLVEVALGHFDLLPAEVRETLGNPLPPESVVTLYGQEIHYYEAGSGPPVILLHGLGGEAAHWVLNIGPLATTHRVYALDLIGFGHSAKPQIDYRIETYVEFLRAFLEHLSVGKAIIVGHSFGGWIAAEFAAQDPDFVDKLVLVDAGGLAPQAKSKAPSVDLSHTDLSRASVAATLNLLHLAFYDQTLVTADLARREFENHMRSGNGYARQRIISGIFLSNQFVDQKVSAIESSTLLIWGRNDRITPPSVGARFEKAIRNSKLVMLDQCGHLPQIEKPAEFNATILRFISGL